MRKFDEARYSCIPYNDLGTYGLPFELMVIAKKPPTIVAPPKEKLIELGGTARIKCDGKGDPTPVISWEKVCNKNLITV